MFFLAVLTWATLTTEPPKILRPFKRLEDCLMAAGQANKIDPLNPTKLKFVCLEVRGEA